MPQNCSHSILISHIEVLQKRTACLSSTSFCWMVPLLSKGYKLYSQHTTQLLPQHSQQAPPAPLLILAVFPGLSGPANPELLILPARQEPPPPPNREKPCWRVFKSVQNSSSERESCPWPTFLKAKLQHVGITDLQTNQQFVRNSSHQKRQTKLDTVSF